MADFRRAGRDRIQPGQILVQFNFQFAIIPILAGNDADVAGCDQIIRVGFSTGNTEFLVQFHRRIRALIATEFQPIIQCSDELSGTVGDISVFQTFEFIGFVGRIGLAVLQIGDARTDGVENIGGRFTGLIEQSHIAARILTDTEDHLALVVGAVILHNRDGRPVNLDGFFHRIGFLGIRCLAELGHTVHYQAAAFVFFLFAQDYILAQGYIVIGLTVSGMPLQFQVAAFHKGIIGRGLLATYGNGGVFGVNRFQLSHVDRIRIKRTSCHTGNLSGNRAVVADGNGIVRSFPHRAGRTALRIGCFFFVFSECTVLGTGGHSPFAQSDGIVQASSCAADSHRILAAGRGTDTKGRGGFARSNAVLAPGGSIGIAQDMIAVGTGISLFQCYVRKSRIADGHCTVGSNGGTADIAAVVADVGIAVFSLEQHVAVGFSPRNSVGDGLGIAIAIRISQVAPGIHLFTGKFDGIAVGVSFHPAFGIGLIDDISIGTIAIQHGTSHVVRAEGHRVHAGSYGAVAESGGVFAQRFRAVTKGRGAIVVGYSFIAKGCGVLS